MDFRAFVAKAPHLTIPRQQRIQHFLDAISGTTAPAAVECQAELTRFVNTLLSGRADHPLSPWLVGAPLTALKRPAGGLRPAAVGDVFMAPSWKRDLNLDLL